MHCMNQMSKCKQFNAIEFYDHYLSGMYSNHLQMLTWNLLFGCQCKQEAVTVTCANMLFRGPFISVFYVSLK